MIVSYIFINYVKTETRLPICSLVLLARGLEIFGAQPLEMALNCHQDTFTARETACRRDSAREFSVLSHLRKIRFPPETTAVAPWLKNHLHMHTSRRILAPSPLKYSVPVSPLLEYFFERGVSWLLHELPTAV